MNLKINDFASPLLAKAIEERLTTLHGDITRVNHSTIILEEHLKVTDFNAEELKSMEDELLELSMMKDLLMEEVYQLELIRHEIQIQRMKIN